jgi:hypothetical protein
LYQTVNSLPPAPPGVVLLHQREGSRSGSDCYAYYVDQIYGTDQSLADIVPYYQERLAANGWMQTYEYLPERDVAAGFRRGDDESMGIFTNRYRDFDWKAADVPPDKLNQYETVYMMEVLQIDSSCPVP